MLKYNNIYNFLRKCAEAYYNGKPLISDEEFDHLAVKYNFNELGAYPSTENKIEHVYPMYSLRNVFDDEADPNVLLNSAVTSPKLDGAAIEVVYEEGHLVASSTRGDGLVGDNIFNNIYLLDSIPKHSILKDTIQVVGEVVAPKEIERARNYAAGALHLKNPEEFATRELTFIAYGIKGYNEDTYLEDMRNLQKWGFYTVVESDWSQFPQDGIVFRENDNHYFEELGYTSKHPRGAFAFKKRSDVVTEETTLNEVKWQLGKGGKVTPVAYFDTVVIDGANVSKATLHNPGFIEEMELCIGDTILITRSGGVIPKVIGKL